MLIADNNSRSSGNIASLDRHVHDEIPQHEIYGVLGEITAQILHDIKNPLGAIQGFATLLAREITEDQQKSTYITKILEGINKIDIIIRELNILEQRKSRKMSFTELRYEVKRILKQLHHDDVISFSIHSPSKLIPVHISPLLFEQMLRRIIQGFVSVSKEVSITLDLFYKQRFVKMTISANKQMESKLVIDELNLLLINKIIDLHNGKYDADFDKARLTITLPLSME